jgi:hypothetical protein
LFGEIKEVNMSSNESIKRINAVKQLVAECYSARLLSMLNTNIRTMTWSDAESSEIDFIFTQRATELMGSVS